MIHYIQTTVGYNSEMHTGNGYLPYNIKHDSQGNVFSEKKCLLWETLDLIRRLAINIYNIIRYVMFLKLYTIIKERIISFLT